jgi:predicted DNA-binding transcriptional regulator YafY
MPINRNALVRFKTIDNCLQNYYRRWTLEDLVEACSDALYEYEGITKGVSKRSVQADIQMMRSDKLGYNAPIIVVEKKYYEYEDRKYSITNIPITGTDLNKLSESVEFLKQFKGFSHFREIEGLIQKLEDHVYSRKNNQRPIIDFDRNEDVKGLEFLDIIYQAILQKSALKMSYKTYKAVSAVEHIIQPLLLKEFRNRWYVIAKKHEQAEILNFALDRIVAIEKLSGYFTEINDFDPVEYYKNVIGVTVEPKADAEEIKLFFNLKTAPYVLTKPIHPSQKLVKEMGNGVIITLHVQHNFELEKEILSFGENVKVLSPANLRRSIAARTLNAADNYTNELTDKQLRTTANKIHYKGFSPIQNVYSKKEINLIKHHLEKQKIILTPDDHDSIDLFKKIRVLKEIILNFSFGKILSFFADSYSVTNIRIINGYDTITRINQQFDSLSLLYCIPLDIDRTIPAFLNTNSIKPDFIPDNDQKEEARNFYLVHGSVLLCKQGLFFTHLNPDLRNKNQIIVIELKLNAKSFDGSLASN